MGLQLLLALGGLLVEGGPARRWMRGPSMFEYAPLPIDCSTAVGLTSDTVNTEYCLQKCQASEHCQSQSEDDIIGFDIKRWRQCLLDLTHKCAFSGSVFYSCPVHDSCTVASTHLKCTKPSYCNIQASDLPGLRWRMPSNETAAECMKHTYRVSGVENPGDDVPQDLTPVLLYDRKSNPWLYIHYPLSTSQKAPQIGSSISAWDMTTNDPKNCLMLEDFDGRSWTISGMHTAAASDGTLILGNTVYGMRTDTNMILPLSVRSEYFLNAVTADLYDV